MLLSGREIKFDMRMLGEPSHDIEYVAIEVRILLKPIADECVDGASISDTRQDRRQRFFQIALAPYAGMHRRFKGPACRFEESRSECLPMDAEILFYRRVPRLSILRFAVPDIDKNPVHIEEYLQDPFSNGSPTRRVSYPPCRSPSFVLAPLLD